MSKQLCTFQYLITEEQSMALTIWLLKREELIKLYAMHFTTIEWKNLMQYIHMMDYYLVLKRKEILTHATT